MNAPVQTPNIALKTALSDELIVNRDGSTAVQKTADLATQLAGEGAISTELQKVRSDVSESIADMNGRLEAAAEGYVVATTWPQLAATPGVRSGQPGRVVTAATSTHTDPVAGGIVPDRGEYSWSPSPQGWRRVGSIVDADARAARGGPIALLAEATGTNEISAALPPAFSGIAISDDTTFMFRAPADNTGPVTLMGLPLLDADGSQLTAGTLRTARRYIARYATFGGAHYRLVTTGLLPKEIARAETVNKRSAQSVIVLTTQGTGQNEIAASIPSTFDGVVLADNSIVAFRAPADNTGPVSLMGLPLRYPDGATELAARELRLGYRYLAVYNTFGSAHFRLLTGVVMRAEIDTKVNAIRGALTAVADLADVYSPLIPLIDRIGRWYDFTDMSTLWQDAGKTIPVRKSGDRIGLVKDKSGQGFDAVQTTAGNRPEFRTGVGGASGVGRFAPGATASLAQFLSLPNRSLTNSAKKTTTFALLTMRPRGGNANICSHAIAGNTGIARLALQATDNRPNIQVRPDDATPVQAWSYLKGGSNDIYNYHVGDWMILEATADVVTGRIELRSNGRRTVDGLATAAARTFPSLDASASYIGHPVNRPDMDVVALIEIVGDLTEEERAGIYKYLRALATNIPFDGLVTYDPSGPLPVVFFWFNAPNVIKVASDQYLVGGVDTGGTVMAGHYNTGTGSVSHAVLHARLEVDDHNIPSFVQLPDGHVIAVYSKHNADGATWLTKTVTAGDYTAWTAPVDIGPQIHSVPEHSYLVSYNFLFRHSGENGRLYYIHREGDLTLAGNESILTQEYWVISWSDDNGETWVRGKKMWGPQRPYTRVWSNGINRLDFFFNDSHPNADSTNRVHHCYFTGGNFYKSDGTFIGSIDTALPLNLDSGPTLVYSANAATTGNAWVWDLTYDAISGRPVGTYVTYNADYSQIDYWQARWTGSEWTRHHVSAAGASLSPAHNVYSGGVVQDPGNIDRIFCSIMVNELGEPTTDRTIGIFQVFRLDTADGGASWTRSQLTHGTRHAFRPVIAPGREKLFYVTGDYGPHYSQYTTDVAVLNIS